MSSREQLLRKRAQELITQLRISRPPVPVIEVAKHLGISVYPYPSESGDISGALIREGKFAVIAFNPANHPNRQRFTIAHEIGHYLFHKLKEYVDQDFRIAWRNQDSSKAIDWEEIEANRFAAELLMPHSMLLEDLDKLNTVDKRTVISLAQRYQVSPEAMKLRLVNLGLLGPF